MADQETPTPQTNITEEGMPGDMGAAATDEFGGTSDEAASENMDDIATDDPGTGGLAGHTGVTAGGTVALGVGGQASPVVQDGATEIAADDAGGTQAASEITSGHVAANGSGAD
jgi:hypothetical protein